MKKEKIFGYKQILQALGKLARSREKKVFKLKLTKRQHIETQRFKNIKYICLTN